MGNLLSYPVAVITDNAGPKSQVIEKFYPGDNRPIICIRPIVTSGPMSSLAFWI